LPVIPAHVAAGLHDTSLAYGNPMFLAATDLAHRVMESGRLRGGLHFLVRRPVAMLLVLFAVCRLPLLEVRISRLQAAAWFAPKFPPAGGPIFGGRWAQAVLDLALDEPAYLAGRRKQALRTNLRRARQLSLQATAVTYDQWFAAACEVLGHRRHGPEVIEQMGPAPEGQPVSYYVATAPGGRPLAYGVVPIFNDCAVLARMLSAPDDPASSPARYLLHSVMRSDLRDRGVRNLIVGTAIRQTPGLQYFQYLLGYEVRNLQITVGDSPD
jgi:hypothetical protein